MTDFTDVLLQLEDGSGDLLLETGVDYLLLDQIPVAAQIGGWAEPWRPREQESELVAALVVAVRRQRRRVTVG